MSVKSIIANVLVYKMLKLLSSPYEKWAYFKDGVIDKDGNIIDSEKSTAYLRFMINIKKLIVFHPMGRLKLSSLPLALTLLRESEEDEIDINFTLLKEELIKHGYTTKD